MKKNEATVLELCVSKMVHVSTKFDYAVTNKELAKYCNLCFAKIPFCSRFLKGHTLSDPETYTSS